MQQRVIILWSLTHATSCNQASIFQDVVAICLLMSFIEAYFWQLWHEDCPGLMVCDWLAHCLHCIQGALFLSKKKDTFSRGVPNWWIWPLMMYFTTDAVKDCSRPFLEISTPLHGVGVKFARGSWPLTAGTVRLRWNLLSDSCRKTCQADVVLCALKTRPHAMHWTGTLPSKDKIRYWPGRCCSTHSHKFSRASHRFGRPRRARLCSGLGLSSTITMQLESDMGQSRLWLPCPGPTGSELACCSGLAICSGWAGLTNLKALTRVWQCGHGLTCTPAKPSRKSCQWPFSKWPLCWTWKCLLKSSPASWAMDWPTAVFSRHHCLCFLGWPLSVKRSFRFTLTGGGLAAGTCGPAGGGVTISGLTGGGMMPAVPPTNLAKSPAFLDGFGAATISATVLFLRFTAGGLPIALAAEGQSAKEPSIAACPLEGVTAEGLSTGACPIVISGIAGSSKHCMPASTWLTDSSRAWESWIHCWIDWLSGGVVSGTSKQYLRW